VHQHFAVARAVHDGAEQLEVFVCRLLPAHGNVDVGRPVLGHELAFVGHGPLVVRRREVHHELEALLGERGERRRVGLAGRVEPLGRRDVVRGERRGRLAAGGAGQCQQQRRDAKARRVAHNRTP
jgi:hypothetical protein